MYTIIVKNVSGSSKIWAGKQFADQEEFTVPQDNNRIKWTQNSTLPTAIAAGEAQIGDGGQFFTDTTEAINWLRGEGGTQDVKVVSQYQTPPFAAKVVPDTGKKLFKRDTGVAYPVVVGNTDCDFVITYPNAKITGVEIIGAELGDWCDFEVYDTPTGTISTVPNYKLNQFGYNVYLSKDYYERMCQYDADLIQDMKIRVKYNSVSSKTIYINFIIHQVI